MALASSGNILAARSVNKARACSTRRVFFLLLGATTALHN
jgi:hypothetical protein